MRLEITPIYIADVDDDGIAIEATKKLVSIRKRVHLLDGSMFAEWLLDWGTGEWRPAMEMPWNVEINDEMRECLGWRSDAFAV